MSSALKVQPDSHVVDILGNTKGRDQPIMLMEKAVELVSCFDSSVFSDEKTVFLDPFCKAGEVLLAAALRSCLLTKTQHPQLTTKREIFHELYSGRYYAVAPDERHYLLSKRTFYGNINSHNPKVAAQIRCGNYVSETDGRLKRDCFETELKNMIEFIRKSRSNARIVAVGNPPYQESDGGFGGSATAIYNLFVEALMDAPSITEFALVIPSRWFTSGKGVDSFRDRIINSSTIKAIHHFKNSKSVFPTVDVLGGICFLHYKADHKGGVMFHDGEASSVVDLKKHDIILDDPRSYDLVEKLKAAWHGKYVSEIAWTRKPFGLPTDHFKKNDEASSRAADAIPCYSKGRSIRYVRRSEITKNEDKIDQYKVAVQRAYAPGSKLGVRRVTIPKDQIFLITKGEVTTETYNVVGSFKTMKEAERFVRYLQTDFARYLLGLRKVTQDIPKDRWDWVPLVDMNTEWTDELLFDRFQLTKQEREHIKKKVKEWS